MKNREKTEEKLEGNGKQKKERKNKRKKKEKKQKKKEKKGKKSQRPENNGGAASREVNPHFFCSLISRRVCLCRETIRSLSIPKINICKPKIINRVVRIERGMRVIPWNH